MLASYQSEIFNRAILLEESHKLDLQRPLDESLRPKKWQIQAKPTWHHFGGKINWFRPNGEHMIGRPKMQS
jgi:hypothetical protein